LACLRALTSPTCPVGSRAPGERVGGGWPCARQQRGFACSNGENTTYPPFCHLPAHPACPHSTPPPCHHSYTGEDGFELSIPNSGMLTIAEKLVADPEVIFLLVTTTREAEDALVLPTSRLHNTAHSGTHPHTHRCAWPAWARATPCASRLGCACMATTWSSTSPPLRRGSRGRSASGAAKRSTSSAARWVGGTYGT
jgi:hypothetical protein